jgi:ribosomal protein S18 acetylase RimI-like enzyme
MTCTVGAKRAYPLDSNGIGLYPEARRIGSMTDSARYRVVVLTENDWRKLRDIRLSALADDPRAFLATYECEAAYDKRRWRREFVRGEWNVMCSGAEDVGLLGVTWEPGMPHHGCHLEFLWIAPGSRRAGAATILLRTVLDRLRDSGVRTVWLWLLDGNAPAMRLYQGFGFQSTNEVQPLPGDRARTEERLRLHLD